jgi:uncharacterized repeat protein (TIGR01451 family)
LLGGSLLVVAVMLAVTYRPALVRADPIEPPVGYPKLALSTKWMTPTLAATGGVTLHYAVEVRNAGVTTASGVTLIDHLPVGTVYNGGAQASHPPTPTVAGEVSSWTGEVGFDSTVVVSFSVSVSDTLSGRVTNAAVISRPLSAAPVAVTAETVIADEPILTVEKHSMPAVPGPNKPLTYSLVVANTGQPATGLPITVTDRVPVSTTVLALGPDGVTGMVYGQVVVTWTRRVTLGLGETTVFTFSVLVDDAPGGTVISNTDYQVASPSGVTSSRPHTVTIATPNRHPSCRCCGSSNTGRRGVLRAAGGRRRSRWRP